MYMLNMVIILIVMYCNVVTAIDKIPTYLLRFNINYPTPNELSRQKITRTGCGIYHIPTYVSVAPTTGLAGPLGALPFLLHGGACASGGGGRQHVPQSGKTRGRADAPILASAPSSTEHEKLESFSKP